MSKVSKVGPRCRYAATSAEFQAIGSVSTALPKLINNYRAVPSAAV